MDSCAQVVPSCHKIEATRIELPPCQNLNDLVHAVTAELTSERKSMQVIQKLMEKLVSNFSWSILS